jgi:two-component system, cell cycle sensor histidine kinase and response regulator CckA
MGEESVRGALSERVPGANASRLVPPEHDVDQVLRAVLDAVPDFVARIDLAGRFVFSNRPVRSFDGERLAAEDVFDMLDPAHHGSLCACLDEARRTGKSACREVVGQGTFGPLSQYQLHVSPIRGTGHVVGFALIATDVTQARHAQEAIEESETKLRVAAQGIGMGLFSVDVAHDRASWDRAMYEMLGIAPAPGGEVLATYLRCVHPDDRLAVVESLERAVASGDFEDMEHRIVRPGGEVRWLLCKGATVRDADERVIKLVGGVLDITERRELEERMRHVQKMDAVGQLTAGIAHNFNNMLSGILPSVELALRDATPRSRTFLQNAHSAAERAARMVRQLLLFAGAEDKLSRKRENVLGIVDRTIEFFRATLDRRITIELSTQGIVPTTTLDANQFEQAVLNVLINARDALESVHDRKPRIRVSLTVVYADDGELTRFGPVEHDRYLLVSISDNGTGMDADTQRRIFEPFYTTKETGRGTGLGLAMVYGVMREHAGRVACDSTLAVGTTFHLALPVLDGEASHDDLICDDAPDEIAGRATLLLVDDEEVVLSAVGTLLRDAGYEVLVARDGDEALEVFARCSGSIDLVLLDQSLPALSGSAVLERLLRIDPGAAVVSFSGQATPLPGAMASLEKPVNSRRLLATVRAVLETPRYTRTAE